MSETDITRKLAAWVVNFPADGIPQSVREEGVRTLFNWMGCAVGGARHETVDCALAGIMPFAGRSQATVLGRGERLDVLNTALVNGISSHVLDYDDTHLKTIIHPAGPVASALLAAAEYQPVSGQDFLTALLIGVEVECRIGNSVYPEHYDRGWHITGTAGVFGAAAALGRMLGLDEQRMTWALGIAATQASGLREMFGTMCKSFHPGNAAKNGAMAAYLAQAGFDSSLQAIEAPRGFANVLSTRHDYNEILGGLGEVWEAALNSYKPFACGVVIHPTIDGCQQLREELGSEVERIAAVRLRAHPLVLELTGKREPQTGLETKFSIYHAAACALLRGDGSPTAFTDEAANAPELVALRRKVSATSDTSIHEASVVIEVEFEDGRRIERVIERAIGSRERPLSNQQLEAKFAHQAGLVVGAETTQSLMEMCWRLPELADVGALARASVPDGRRDAAE
ncbi:MmgE/PrpD family protein [Ancylobacter sp. MQZ15Z-1]|uniref:MmgE/PrpD family protein n=1 Tax=Ancylobacter mangrovi TaxID=2972472 RepID=A0A9X2T142_9HYPH|nr:MmgE/PrpD family protein [Ancylobacter mangrovi]MCS0494585.1 MmgE/PrpD family protein [Ancylobacter mangrovi]